MMTGRVLVTGASGFIGSQLVRRLLADGTPVTATARRRTDQLSGELGTPVTPLDVMGELPSFDGVETVVHCASPNDIHSRADDGALPLAVTGTRRLIDHAVRHGVKRLVFLSTLQVYGTELNGPIDEDTPVCCESVYGLNHFLGEEVCRFAARTADIDIVALRPSNVYGVPSVSTVDRATLVPMCFVKEALQTGAVELRSSGRQRRNFVSTIEVADRIAALLSDFPAGYTILNAVSAWDASIVEIAGMVEDAWNRQKDTPLDIRVLSDQPIEGNRFTVTSRHVPPLLTPEESRTRMAEVIDSLIRFEHWN